MKPITGLLALVVVALGAYLLGARSDQHPSSVAARIATTSTPTPKAAPTPDVAPTPAPTATPGQAAMGEAAFWRLIADTRGAAGNDTARQSDLLEQRLSKLPAQQIVDFQRIRHGLDQRAYTWALWGAAYVIEDGCSDDCFRDFRAYLISLGRGPYEAALRDPDSLSPIVQDAEQGGWEDADSVAADAYQSATGEDIPADGSDLSGTPRGQAWDDEDQEALMQRYSHLAARFR